MCILGVLKLRGPLCGGNWERLKRRGVVDGSGSRVQL